VEDNDAPGSLLIFCLTAFINGPSPTLLRLFGSQQIRNFGCGMSIDLVWYLWPECFREMAESVPDMRTGQRAPDSGAGKSAGKKLLSAKESPF
jgi:hypothetical protein